MNALQITCLCTGLFSLGLFIGSIASEFEEWGLGMIISPSRIIGLGGTALSILTALVARFL